MGPTFEIQGADSLEAEIAYRSNTGSNGVSAPKNRTLDGSSWTAAAEQATAGSPIRAVRMAFSPVTADERIFVTQSDDGRLDAFVCNTTCNATNNIGQVWTTAPGTPERRFDIAYEQLSGEALLVYGVLSTDAARDLAYRTYAAGAWSAEQYLDDAGHTNDVQYSLIILASKRGSDQIGLLGTDDTNNDVNAWTWDGGAFGSFVEVNAGSENPAEYQAAIAWESGSGNLLTVSVDSGSATCRYKEFTSDWGAAATFTCGSTSPIRWLSLKPNPVSTADDMVLAVGDNGSDLSTVYWDGTAWSARVTQDTGMDFNSARSFDFAWEDTGSKGLLVWGTTSGQITYRTFTAPGTWGTSTNAAMGTNTHRWVQLRTKPAAVEGGARIFGGVLENGANDLGAVSWDGTNLTVGGAGAFTADTGTTTYESFDLEPRLAATGGVTLNLFGGQKFNLFGFEVELTTLLFLVVAVVGVVIVLAVVRSRRRRGSPRRRSNSSSEREKNHARKSNSGGHKRAHKEKAPEETEDEVEEDAPPRNGGDGR